MTEPLSTLKRFCFPLNRQHDNTHPFHNVGGAYNYWLYTGLAEIVDKIIAVDEFTIQMNLKTPYAPLLPTLAITAFAIVSPTALQKWGEDFTNHPVGTGPSSLCDGIGTIRLSLRRMMHIGAVDHRWIGFIFQSIPDNSVRLINFKREASMRWNFQTPTISNRFEMTRWLNC